MDSRNVSRKDYVEINETNEALRLSKNVIN